MTVWVVMEEVPFEGECLVDVYATEESASAWADEHNGKPHYGYYHVYEYEVQP